MTTNRDKLDAVFRVLNLSVIGFALLFAAFVVLT